MAVEAFPDIPDQFTSGDGFSWSEVLADYSAASNWEVRTLFRNDDGEKIELEASGSGTTWTTTVTSGESGRFSAGIWTYTKLAFLLEDRRTITTGRVRVLPDPEAEAVETHATKMRKACEARLEGRLEDDEAERITIGGQSLDKIPTDMVLKFYNHYLAKERGERNLDRQRRGLRSRRTRGIKFV